ncbi:MAG: hypothetical protein IPF55_08585 [Rhodoferax sp.]|nr:hypothetical protein [Rhodoferax sp.]
MPRLTPSDLGLWLQRLSGNVPPPAFANWLHARSGGNPFFALETLRALFNNGRCAPTPASGPVILMH